MVSFGYALSSEEHTPNRLVELAAEAEGRGFEFTLISDHFHPWIDAQGHSPFVWSVLGGIAARTSSLRVGTGVTCPTMRIHPAVIAQAAATTAAMMGDRFFLGLGSGENLNEHILGDRWPNAEERLAMLEEAVEVMRTLWEGELTSFDGEFFSVDTARLYTLPERPPKIVMAAGGTKSAELAARVGDGLVVTSPDRDVIGAWRAAGGSGPVYGQVTVSYSEDEGAAVKTLETYWPNAGIKGPLSQELPLPSHFEAAAGMVDIEEVARSLPCGPDPERYVRTLADYADAGVDHVYIHQVGPDQDAFFRFWTDELAKRVPR